MKEKKARERLASVARYFHQRQWSLSTSSNFSARLNKNEILITKSGKDKALLKPKDLMVINEKGRALRPKKAKSSAETLLHLHLYDLFQDSVCVLHVHSPFATILSMAEKADFIELDGFEMAKAFKNVKTHEHIERVPVVDNSQDMNDIIARLEKRLNDNVHAYLIRGHGFYTWAQSIEKAKYQVEAFEFLFNCYYHLKIISKSN